MSTDNIGQPVTLLDGVTSTGAGSVHNMKNNHYSCVISYATAAPTSLTIKLQGSLDDSKWVDLGSSNDKSATVVGFAVAWKPFDYIRGNLTAYTAGSCTGVTLKITEGKG